MMSDPNRGSVLLIAKRMDHLLDQIVFLGGCAAGLLITDSGAAPMRVTDDVDVIAEIGSYAEYADFGYQLRGLGFVEDTTGPVICRWIVEGIYVDVIPTSAEVLGFSNRWYEGAIKTATLFALEGVSIRMINAPYFLATKLEAFTDRGDNDYRASQDLEDIIAVVDGRPSIVEEVAASDDELRSFLSESLEGLLQTAAFVDALPGYLPPDAASQARLDLVVSRLRAIASL
jgi:predicted nucleotidyltransferase